MNRLQNHASIACWVCLIALLSLSVNAGPLTPPGAPAPTMLTLDQIDGRIPIGPDTTPGDASNTYIITQRGSYYLTENLLGEAGKSGIKINAYPVTIDLNGYALDGQNVGAIGIHRLFSATSGVTVRNGKVHSWTSDGIDLAGSTGEGGLIEDVIASDNGGIGIKGSIAGLIRNCVSNSNGGIGILVNDRGRAVNCVASGNLVGIAAEVYSTVQDCSISKNTDRGIQADAYSKIINCDVANSNFYAIQAVGDLVTISGCKISSSSLFGISV
ncbi:MAG: right-handed parallel beta-helix repeat-containing protein, partial [Planctomycetota bacterium]